MILIFFIDDMCTICHKTWLNTFIEHVNYCKEFLDFKYNHDFVRNVLFYIFRRTGVLVKKETLVNFLTDPQDRKLILRSANVVVYGCVGGKHACVDLTGVSPLMELKLRAFTIGHTSLNVA